MEKKKREVQVSFPQGLARPKAAGRTKNEHSENDRCNSAIPQEAAALDRDTLCFSPNPCYRFSFGQKRNNQLTIRAHDLYQKTYLYTISTLRDRRCCEIYTYLPKLAPCFRGEE